MDASAEESDNKRTGMLRKKVKNNKNNKSRHLANSDSEWHAAGTNEREAAQQSRGKGQRPLGQRGPHDLRDRIKFMNCIRPMTNIQVVIHGGFRPTRRKLLD